MHTQPIWRSFFIRRTDTRLDFRLPSLDKLKNHYLGVMLSSCSNSASRAENSSLFIGTWQQEDLLFDALVWKSCMPFKKQQNLLIRTTQKLYRTSQKRMLRKLQSQVN